MQESIILTHDQCGHAIKVINKVIIELKLDLIQDMCTQLINDSTDSYVTDNKEGLLKELDDSIKFIKEAMDENRILP